MIAGIRVASNAASTALQTLPHGQNSNLVLVKTDSASETDAKGAINTLKVEHGIDHLDIMIANAGISNYFGKAAITPAHEMETHSRSTL